VAHQIELSKETAIPIVLCVLGAAYFLQPAEFRRGPILELQGVVGMAPKYEVAYRACEDGQDQVTMDAKGIGKGLVGGYDQRFIAKNDDDAVTFARQARPQCTLRSVSRLVKRPRLNSSTRSNSYRRIPLDI